MSLSITPNNQIFLANLQLTENRISTDEQEMSSGLRVSVASDAPDQISGILQLRAQIAGVQQTQNNLSSVSAVVNSGEDAIQQAIQVLDTATALATEASGSTSSASQRLDAAPQVQGILEQLVSLSQTTMNGEYIFSGDQSGSPSYQLNAAGTGVTQVVQPGPPGQIADTNGVLFSVGLTAQQIFDDQVGGGTGTGNPAPDNVFAAVSGLLTALQTNSSAGIQTALTNLQAASAHLNDESSFYGGAANSISSATSQSNTTLTQLQQQLSNMQDADIAEVAVDLNTNMTAEQAAMSAEAMNKPQSLFSYLG